MGKSTTNRAISGLLDIIAPQALDFGPRQISFGDQLARILYIRDYPPKAGAAWLARITKLPGVTVSTHVVPTDSLDLIQTINRSLGEYQGRLDVGTSALSRQRLNQNIEDGTTLLKKIDQEQQSVFWFITVVMIIAADQESLNRKTRRVETILAGAGMRGRILIFEQKEGLLAAGPWAILPQKVLEEGARNMPSETVAAAFPFVATGINDGKGIILGRDQDDGIVLLDMWKRPTKSEPSDRTNSNWIILAMPGAGKSFTFKVIATRELAQGTRVIVIDPEREYKEWCENLGGTWINCAGGKGRINPLQIRAGMQDDEEPQDKEDAANGLGSLAIHLQVLRIFFSLYLRELSEIDKVNLEETLLEVYNKKGITWTTDPKEVGEENWPTTKDLYERLNEKAQSKPETWSTLAALLKRTAEGADAPLWAGPTTAKAQSDLVVLDTYDFQKASQNVKAAQYYNIFTWVWEEIARDRSEKILFGADEFHTLADTKTPEALEASKDLSKRARKYSGGIIPITQNVIDLLDPAIERFGQAIVNNPTYKLLLRQGEKDLQVLSSLLNLTEAETDFLSNANQGEGLLIAGSQRFRVKIEASDYEISLFGKGGGR